MLSFIVYLYQLCHETITSQAFWLHHLLCTSLIPISGEKRNRVNDMAADEYLTTLSPAK